MLSHKSKNYFKWHKGELREAEETEREKPQWDSVPGQPGYIVKWDRILTTTLNT